MATRLSQKQVTEYFYQMCKDAGVPTTGKSPRGRKRGFLTMGGAYGGIRVEYVYKCGGISNISSGFVGAREMLIWLSNFSPRAMYKYYQQQEKRVCESMKRRAEAQKKRGPI